MKFFFINALTFLIVLSSIFLDSSYSELTQFQDHSLQKVPLFQIDSLKNPSDKVSEKNLFIAKEFIPIVVLADVQDSNTSFSHYLSIYDLYRQKEYFLLI